MQPRYNWMLRKTAYSNVAYSKNHLRIIFYAEFNGGILHEIFDE